MSVAALSTSVEGAQDTSTSDAEMALAEIPLGTVGGVMSGLGAGLPDCLKATVHAMNAPAELPMKA